jgi:hypothetical protein
MIGRGSRIHKNKSSFKVIDLGNNVIRFGPWSQPVDWQHIFKNPDYYLENLRLDEDIERDFVYEMPDSLRKRFKKNPNDDFDIKEEYKNVIREGHKSMKAIENSIAQHSELVIANSEDVFEARELAKLLHDDICYRIKQYCYCIMNSTKNYKDWLLEEYTRKLRLSFNGKF